MWVLGPGMVVGFIGDWGELVNLRTGERFVARREDVPLLRAVAGGIVDESRAPIGLQTVAEAGWTVQADSPHDDFLAERLSILDRRYGWCARDVPEAALDVVRRAHASRRHYHRGFGQYAALPETVGRRVALAGAAPKRILVLGDDDFLSLGLAAAGHEVTVAEIDDLITTHIERLRQPDWKLEIIRRDLRDPWPEELRGAFDAFFADPLSGPMALRLFVARGLHSLKPGGTGHLCVSELGQPIFESIRREADIELVEHYSDFNHYYDPHVELAHYVSDMMVLRGDRAHARPEPDARFYAPGLSVEAHFSISPSSRYVIHGINTKLAEHIHIDTAIGVLKESGELKVLSEQRNVIDNLRSYLALTDTGSAVHIRADLETGIGELFVAPADHDLEDAVLLCLLSLWRKESTVVQKLRLRNASVMRIL